MLQNFLCPSCKRTFQLDADYTPTNIICPFCNNHINFNKPADAPSSKISLSLGDLGLGTPASNNVSAPNTSASSSAGAPSPASSSMSAPAAEPTRRLSPRQRRLLSDEHETREYFKDGYSLSYASRIIQFYALLF